MVTSLMRIYSDEFHGVLILPQLCITIGKYPMGCEIIQYVFLIELCLNEHPVTSTLQMRTLFSLRFSWINRSAISDPAWKKCRADILGPCWNKLYHNEMKNVNLVSVVGWSGRQFWRNREDKLQDLSKHLFTIAQTPNTNVGA